MTEYRGDSPVPFREQHRGRHHAADARISSSHLRGWDSHPRSSPSTSRPGLQDRIHPVHGYEGSDANLLLLHHSLGHPTLRRRRSVASRSTSSPCITTSRRSGISRTTCSVAIRLGREQLAVLAPDARSWDRRFQLQPAGDARGGVSTGRGLARPDRLQRSSRRPPQGPIRAPRSNGLALCRADRGQQVPARAGRRRSPSTSGPSITRGAAPSDRRHRGRRVRGGGRERRRVRLGVNDRVVMLGKVSDALSDRRSLGPGSSSR